MTVLLRGLLGADTLTGGDGADRFIYGAPGEGDDVITDFLSGEDKIVIDLFGFGGGLVAGGAVTLLASPNPTGGGAEPVFRYNTSTGELYWDADGAGGDPGVPIATLIGAPLLTTSDFILGG